MTELARTSAFRTEAETARRDVALETVTIAIIETKRTKYSRRGLIAVALLVIAVFEGSVGYRHFANDSVAPEAVIDEDTGSSAVVPITGYTDAVWVNGWSGPHLDH